MGQKVHVTPVGDIIDHTEVDDECICGPTVEHVPSDDDGGTRE